jgi:hypothetical protein
MPSKLTPEVHDKIVKLVRAGNYRETACAAAGITSRTMRDWMKLGDSGLEPYEAFLRDVDQAEAEAEARDVTQIAKASADDWRAAAWRLERKSHERWAYRGKEELTVRTEDPKTLTREQLVARITQLAVAEGILPGQTVAGALGVGSPEDDEEDDR